MKALIETEVSLLFDIQRLAKELKELKEQVDDIEEQLDPDYCPDPKPTPPGSILDAIDGFKCPFQLYLSMVKLTPPEILKKECKNLKSMGALIDFLSGHWKKYDGEPGFIKGLAYAYQETPIKFKSQEQ